MEGVLMSGDDELGRPKYTARPTAGGRGAVPPNGPPVPGIEPGGRGQGRGPGRDQSQGQSQGRQSRPSRRDQPAAAGPAPLWPGQPEPESAWKQPDRKLRTRPEQKPPKPKAKPKPKAEPKQPEQPQTILVPLERRGRNWLWLLMRFIVLTVVRLVLTIAKVALWPFAHIVGHD
jgi:hypothetical protein